MPVVWGQVIIKINVDAWRHNLFKSGKCSDDLLPPTCGSLVKHFEQANSQSAICSQCLIAAPLSIQGENNLFTSQYLYLLVEVFIKAFKIYILYIKNYKIFYTNIIYKYSKIQFALTVIAIPYLTSKS